MRGIIQSPFPSPNNNAERLRFQEDGGGQFRQVISQNFGVFRLASGSLGTDEDRGVAETVGFEPTIGFPL